MHLEWVTITDTLKKSSIISGLVCHLSNIYNVDIFILWCGRQSWFRCWRCLKANVKAEQSASQTLIFFMIYSMRLSVGTIRRMYWGITPWDLTLPLQLCWVIVLLNIIHFFYRVAVDEGENQEDPSLEVIVFFSSLIHILSTLSFISKWCHYHTSPAPLAVTHTKHDVQ